MPFNGSGVFVRVRNWVSDATAGIKIRSDYHDQEDDGIAAGLSNTITRDGQSVITANIPFNMKRITNLGDPVNDQDALTKLWAQANLISGAHINDAPPAAANVGNLWWDSDSGNLFVKYDDGTSVQWVQVNVASPRIGIGSPFKRTVFPTAGAQSGFQFDASALFADIEVQGAGGGGGGTTAALGTANTASAGSGGGGGGYAKKLIEITPAVRANNKTIFVGAGGAGASSGAQGATGGVSSYADGVNSLTGNGGIGGFSGVYATQVGIRVGGNGVSGSGGDIVLLGQPGAPGFGYGATPCGAGSAAAAGGNGGASALGYGGLGGVTFSTAAAAGAGGGGGGVGGGGAGAWGVHTVSPAIAGGQGGNGLVIISEYR